MSLVFILDALIWTRSLALPSIWLSLISLENCHLNNSLGEIFCWDFWESASTVISFPFPNLLNSLPSYRIPVICAGLDIWPLHPCSSWSSLFLADGQENSKWALLTTNTYVSNFWVCEVCFSFHLVSRMPTNKVECLGFFQRNVSMYFEVFACARH